MDSSQLAMRAWSEAADAWTAHPSDETERLCRVARRTYYETAYGLTVHGPEDLSPLLSASQCELCRAIYWPLVTDEENGIVQRLCKTCADARDAQGAKRSQNANQP